MWIILINKSINVSKKVYIDEIQPQSYRERHIF